MRAILHEVQPCDNRQRLPLNETEPRRWPWPLNVDGDLGRHFGDYKSPRKAHDWEKAKESLALGTSVSGIVVAQYPFGVFLDIGQGFPALLLVVRFKDAGKVRYGIDDYPAIGSTIAARVCVFADPFRQIRLTQLEREDVLGE